MNKKFWSSFVIILAIFVTVIFVARYVYKQEHRAHILEVYVFKKKGGPVVFVRTPNDKRLLVDSGSNAEIIRDLTEILPFYDKHIDALLATDEEDKHVTGFVDILDRIGVGNVYVPAINLESLGLASTSPLIYSVFLKTASEKSVPIKTLKALDEVAFDGEVEIKALFPVVAENFEYSKTSYPQIILSIKYGKTSVVLLFGATKKIQRYLNLLDVVSDEESFIVRNSKDLSDTKIISDGSRLYWRPEEP